MPVIAGQGRRAYLAGMSRLINLLTLIALALMPFSMAAPAAAAGHHPSAVVSGSQHCPDQEGVPRAMDGISECTMACAAALPVFNPDGGQSLAPDGPPSLRVLAAPLTGLHPETATPPPRSA